MVVVVVVVIGMSADRRLVKTLCITNETCRRPPEGVTTMWRVYTNAQWRRYVFDA